jgi:hypothetical protein
MGTRLKRWGAGFGNLTLCGGAILFSLAVAEGTLRIAAPQYQYAASANFDYDNYRIISRSPNVHASGVHPDDGRTHSIIYNNFALRHHRDIMPADLDGRTLAVFFGDSFTENLRIPVQYSFTELLDFKLNEDEYEPPSLVLNFGVDGYSVDQAFLYYMNSEIAQQADHVFYVFCANDIRGLYENQLFRLEDGLLQRSQAQAPSWLVRAASRLYLTYLVLDARQVLRAKWGGMGGDRDFTAADILSYKARHERRQRLHSPEAGAIEANLVGGEWQRITEHLDLMMKIVSTWRDEVERRGASFHVVLLPREDEHAAAPLFRGQYSVIDLYEEFRQLNPSYDYADIRFRNDGHWNERGNLMAAVVLYRWMREISNRTVADRATLEKRVGRYLDAFGGWRPTPTGAGTLASPPGAREQDWIRIRYTALDHH